MPARCLQTQPSVPWDISPLVYWHGLSEKHRENSTGFTRSVLLHLQFGLSQEITSSIVCYPRGERTLLVSRLHKASGLYKEVCYAFIAKNKVGRWLSWLTGHMPRKHSEAFRGKSTDMIPMDLVACLKTAQYTPQ